MSVQSAVSLNLLKVLLGAVMNAPVFLPMAGIDISMAFETRLLCRKNFALYQSSRKVELKKSV